MSPESAESEWWLTVPAETIEVALTLAQTRWWVDSESKPHLVETMTNQYRLAVIDYLVSRSQDLLIAVQETEIRSRRGNAAHRAASDLLEGGATLAQSESWLESTPLMQRLRLLTWNRDVQRG